MFFVRIQLVLGLFCLFTACQTSQSNSVETSIENEGVQLIVLGTVQDGGSPHLGCTKSCCSDLTAEQKAKRMVSCLGLVNNKTHEYWVFDASPDFSKQDEWLHKEYAHLKPQAAGIFLTHAHIGHYTGLMYLGREAQNAQQLPVYAMPRMLHFLKNNGPWSQLVDLKNIALVPITSGESQTIDQQIKVTPIVVPHRDEFSETVGYHITGPTKSALFIPDIDKWNRWDEDINEWIGKVDYAFLDATFYDGDELKNRAMSEIPHPFVVESIAQFETLSETDKRKIYFIHLNHSNPLLLENSAQSLKLKAQPYQVARLGLKVNL